MMVEGPTDLGRRRLLHAIAVLAAVVLGAFTARVKQHLTARFGERSLGTATRTEQAAD